MSVFSRSNCWLCDAMFGTWSALKKHMQGPAHGCLTVICPWCLRKEKTFTRVADMKFHAMNAHTHEGLEDAHFGRGVGFYYCKHPQDYVRLVEDIASYEDANACKARNVMRRWAESMEGKDNLLNKLNKGWKVERRSKSKDRAREETSGTKTVERRSKSKDRTGRSRSREERSGDKQEERRETKKDTGKRNGRPMEKRIEDSRKVVERVDERGDRRKESSDSGEVTKQSERKTDESRKRMRTPEKEEEPKKRKETVREKEVTEEEEDLDRYEDDIHLDDAYSSSGSSDTESEMEERDRPTTGVSDLRMRATRLLMQGVMPMCPPAQRDWTKAREIEIESFQGNFNWPPAGWTSLSPDQKLLAHEHMAMTLEQGRTGKARFPIDLSRRTLLDKYNFLSLEGAARPKIEEGRQGKAEVKARYYLYQFLSDIAKGRAPENMVTVSTVKSLERADRWKDTDLMTELLDSASIKLRV